MEWGHLYTAGVDGRRPRFPTGKEMSKTRRSGIFFSYFAIIQPLASRLHFSMGQPASSITGRSALAHHRLSMPLCCRYPAWSQSKPRHLDGLGPSGCRRGASPQTSTSGHPTSDRGSTRSRMRRTNILSENRHPCGTLSPVSKGQSAGNKTSDLLSSSVGSFAETNTSEKCGSLVFVF